MNENPILEEVWRIKDELAAEAGGNVDRFFEQLRAWSATHPHKGPVARSPEELRRVLAEMARQRSQSTGATPQKETDELKVGSA